MMTLPNEEDPNARIRRGLRRIQSELRESHGATADDALAVSYLETVHGLPRRRALGQVAFGGGAGGVHAFHVDVERRNLYLYVFRNRAEEDAFTGALRAMVETGMEAAFGPEGAVREQGVLRLRRCLVENRSVIDQVLVRLVFLGDPAEAGRGELLGKLLEDLESKHFLVDQAFDRPGGVRLAIDLHSLGTDDAAPMVVPPQVRRYEVAMSEPALLEGPGGEVMHVGFASLMDLLAIRRAMGARFLERNIRGALAATKSVNRALDGAFRRIVVDGTESAEVFPFHHNGVALAAEAISFEGATATLTEPRLLNGAQTVAAFDRCMEGLGALPEGDERLSRAGGLRVLCKVVTRARGPFVTTVTVNNNRQNPVSPWNLRANDDVQLELADKFRRELGLFYERQEHAFDNLSDDERDEAGIVHGRAVEMLPLARTFIVVDGDIALLTNLTSVFEDERLYGQVFSPARLKADPGRILLAYKAQARLRKLMDEIVDKGPSKYGFITRARSLIWALLVQGMLNDEDLDGAVERFGNDLVVSQDYTEWLARIATTRVRMILSDLVAAEPYASRIAEGAFSCLRTNAAYKQAMAVAGERFGWVRGKLR